MEVLKERAVQLVAVTGGGSGIGRAVCRYLAECGFEVVALGRTRANLEETAQGHNKISIKPLDVRDMTASNAVFEEIKDEFGQPVDGLVASAGIYPRVHFLDQSAESFDDTIVTNVLGVANVIRAVLPDMLARNMGRITVLGSFADQNPIPTAVAYSSSKGGVHALVKGIAAEIDRERYPNVLINELNPGATRTAMSNHGQPPEAVAPFVKVQLEFPSGGHHGTCWTGHKQNHLGDGLKSMLLRKLKLKR